MMQVVWEFEHGWWVDGLRFDLRCCHQVGREYVGRGHPPFDTRQATSWWVGWEWNLTSHEDLGKVYSLTIVLIGLLKMRSGDDPMMWTQTLYVWSLWGECDGWVNLVEISNSWPAQQTSKVWTSLQVLEGHSSPVGTKDEVCVQDFMKSLSKCWMAQWSQFPFHLKTHYIDSMECMSYDECEHELNSEHSKFWTRADIFVQIFSLE